MKKAKRTIGVVLVSLALILSILACGGGTTSPTAVPAKVEPSATTAKVEKPTATKKAVEPTAEPTAEPTTEPTSKPVPTKKVSPTQAPSNTSGSASCAEAADGELGVAYVHGYMDNFDTLRVVGLVCNKTERAVSNVQLELEVLDKDGKSLYTEKNGYTSLYSLDVGEETPFSIGIYEDLPDADSVIATIVGNDSTEINRAALDTQGILTTVDDSGNIHITGELINNGSDPVEIHGLAGATFDVDGAMVTADYSSVIIHYLDPGDTGPFRVTMTGPKDGTDAVDTYQLYVDAETTDQADFLVDATTDLVDHTDFMDTYGQFHLVGEYTNNGDKSISVRLVATIYDTDENVLDASSADTPFTAVAPGETIPYEFSYWGPLDDKEGVYDAADHFTVQVDPMWTWTTDTELFDLTVAEDNNEFDEYQGTFTGKVENTSGGDIGSAVVIVSIHAKADNAITTMGYSYADITDKLADGKSADYTVYVPIPEGMNIDDYEYTVTAKGTRP